MKRLLTICLAVVAALLLVSCNKEAPEAYPGERTLVNTAWGYFPDGAINAKWFVVFYSYDQGCAVCIRDENAQQCHYMGKYVFEESTHKVTITPVIDKDTPDTIPTELSGTVDASGLNLQWSYFHGEDQGKYFSQLFTYICPADQLG